MSRCNETLLTYNVSLWFKNQQVWISTLSSTSCPLSQCSVAISNIPPRNYTLTVQAVNHYTNEIEDTSWIDIGKFNSIIGFNSFTAQLFGNFVVESASMAMQYTIEVKACILIVSCSATELSELCRVSQSLQSNITEHNELNYSFIPRNVKYVVDEDLSLSQTHYIYFMSSFNSTDLLVVRNLTEEVPAGIFVLNLVL